MTATPIDEIREWLTQNRSTLVDRAPHEIALLAVACGFDVDAACEALAHWTIDARTRTTQALRVDWSVGREIKALEVRAGSVDLLPQWTALRRKVALGRDFDE